MKTFAIHNKNLSFKWCEKESGENKSSWLNNANYKAKNIEKKLSFTGYQVVLSLCKLGDVSISPSAIIDEQFARLHKEAQDLADACKLLPLDFDNRMNYLSGIFRSEISNTEFDIATLPDSIYDNCNELKKAFQLEKLYQPFNNCRTLEELRLSTTLYTTFLYNGKPAMEALTTELHLKTRKNHLL